MSAAEVRRGLTRDGFTAAAVDAAWSRARRTALPRRPALRRAVRPQPPGATTASGRHRIRQALAQKGVSARHNREQSPDGPGRRVRSGALDRLARRYWRQKARPAAGAAAPGPVGVPAPARLPGRPDRAIGCRPCGRAGATRLGRPRAGGSRVETGVRVRRGTSVGGERRVARTMTADEIRAAFLGYFEERGHRVVRSSRSCPRATPRCSSPTPA